MYDTEKHSAVLENVVGFARLDVYIYIYTYTVTKLCMCPAVHPSVCLSAHLHGDPSVSSLVEHNWSEALLDTICY